MTTLQAGGGGIMMWKAFSWCTPSPLIFGDTTLNSTAYVSIVADRVHSFMAIMFPYINDHFHQDNVPCHGARLVKNCFEEFQSEFNLYLWPAQSSDFSPIEHLWDEVERAIKACKPPICHHPIWPNLQLPLYQHGQIFIINVISNLLTPCQEYRL